MYILHPPNQGTYVSPHHVTTSYGTWGGAVLPVSSRRVNSAHNKFLLNLKSLKYTPSLAKNTRCAWAGGTFFPVVLLCQFLVLAGNRFWFYLLCTYVLRVQYSCGVVLVFWFWWEIVLVLRMYLVYNTVVRLCQFFGCCGGKMFSKCEHVYTRIS
jgi:hypothetical protein